MDAKAVLRSIRSVSKLAQVPVLESLSHIRLAQGFVARERLPGDRKEALPLPLAALLFFELPVLSEGVSEADIIFLGSVITMTWASLRFIDGQGLYASQLTIAEGVFR